MGGQLRPSGDRAQPTADGLGTGGAAGDDSGGLFDAVLPAEDVHRGAQVGAGDHHDLVDALALLERL